MQGLAPAVQTDSPGTGDNALQAETGQPAPLIDGPAPALWAGAGGVLLIFLVGMLLIIRGRVTPGKALKEPAKSRSFFEPAGAGADITFEEDDPNGPEPEATNARESWLDDEVSGTELIIDHDQKGGSLHDEERAFEEAPPAPSEPKPEKQKKPAFAGLFGKKAGPELKAQPDFETPEPDDEPFHVNAADDDLGFFAPEPEASQQAERDAAEPPPAAAPSAAEAARLAEAEEKAKEALRRAEDAEARARDLERAGEEAKRTMSLEVQKREAALEERAEAMAAMERRLAAMSEEFQERLEAASADNADEAPESLGAYHDAPAIVSEEHFAEFANLMGEQFDVLRGEVNSAVEKLSKRLDNLPTAPGAATATAARVQLTDLLGDALAPQRYKLNHRLPTGRTAEAAILMPGPMAPLAIDARFPVEAFDAWQLSRNAGTETELRRAVLRNIADAGEKLIVAEETADCAMMFIPSENILSELHAHFSDLVQESYRARVFMVSPTSLMATLHTISAVLAGAGVRETSAMSFLEELHALRARVAALETLRQNGAAAALKTEKTAAKPSLGAAHYAFDRPPHKGGEGDDKSPFPLR